MSEWNTCPICAGCGHLMGDYYLRDDGDDQWQTLVVVSNTATRVCNFCYGCYGKGSVVKPEPQVIGQTVNYDFLMTPEYIERD